MMTKEEFERVFKACYNPSITKFKEEDGESWNDLAPDFAEKCNYTGEDRERSACKGLSPRQTIHPIMPPASCPNCGAEIAPFNGESPKFCMCCGFRLVSDDGSYAEPRSSGNALYDRVREAVIGGTLVDHRSESYDREVAIDAFNRMARLELLSTNEQMSAHFANACAVAAMVIANDPDPYLVLGMTGTLESMGTKLLTDRGMRRAGGSVDKKCRDIRSYGRNVSSLHGMLKGRSVAENRSMADAARMRLAGDPAWQSAASKAADALMDTGEPDQKSSLLFGKNVVCKGAKAFEEYVRVLCGRPLPG